VFEGCVRRYEIVCSNPKEIAMANRNAAATPRVHPNLKAPEPIGVAPSGEHGNQSTLDPASLAPGGASVNQLAGRGQAVGSFRFVND